MRRRGRGWSCSAWVSLGCVWFLFLLFFGNADRLGWFLGAGSGTGELVVEVERRSIGDGGVEKEKRMISSWFCCLRIQCPSNVLPLQSSQSTDLSTYLLV